MSLKKSGRQKKVRPTPIRSIVNQIDQKEQKEIDAKGRDGERGGKRGKVKSILTQGTGGGRGREVINPTDVAILSKRKVLALDGGG